MSSFSSRWSSYVPTKEPAEEKSFETPKNVPGKTDKSPEPRKVLIIEPSAGTVPRLPWQLERLVSAAHSDQLPKGTVTLPAGFIPDLNRYTLGWAAAYLTGDRTEALSRLWQARRAWQGETPT